MLKEEGVSLLHTIDRNYLWSISVEALNKGLSTPGGVVNQNINTGVCIKTHLLNIKFKLLVTSKPVELCFIS